MSLCSRFRIRSFRFTTNRVRQSDTQDLHVLVQSMYQSLSELLCTLSSLILVTPSRALLRTLQMIGGWQAGRYRQLCTCHNMGTCLAHIDHSQASFCSPRSDSNSRNRPVSAEYELQQTTESGQRKTVGRETDRMILISTKAKLTMVDLVKALSRRFEATDGHP
jgi:hypothetical protein